jgi:peptide/nickel transport system permease protein
MAKGLHARTVMLRHGFRNTLIPFVTLIGLVFPGLISGSVILEVMFNWPGLGRLLYDSILQRDYPVVMTLTTASAVLVLAGTLVVDLLYGVIDPRVSHD